MTDDFREDCERNITINSRGAIVYESILEKRYPVRLVVLLSIIEDHIVEDNVIDCEHIDWPEVWKEMDKCE